MTYFVAYIAVLVVFGAIDAGWLSTMGNMLYRPTLSDILLQNLRIAPALAFYALYPIGVVVFAVLPALRAGSLATAFFLALLFGNSIKGKAPAPYDGCYSLCHIVGNRRRQTVNPPNNRQARCGSVLMEAEPRPGSAKPSPIHPLDGVDILSCRNCVPSEVRMVVG